MNNETDIKPHLCYWCGKHNEAEPFVDDVIIPIGSVVDCTSWKHALIRSQK